VSAVIAAASSALVKQRSVMTRRYMKVAEQLLRSLSPSDWWNDAVVMGVADRLVSSHLRLTEISRRLGTSYAKQVLREIGIKADLSKLNSKLPVRYGTDPQLELARFAQGYRSQAVKQPDVRPLSWDSPEGLIAQEWVNAGIARLEELANMDSTMSTTLATHEAFLKNGVTMYRRIIHPELSQTGVCGLCVVASTRIYHIKNPLPIHQNCKCTVSPIIDGKDPGLDVSQVDLSRIYKEAGSTYGADLKKLRVTIAEHGELGPILTRSGMKTSDKATKWQLPDSEEATRQLEAMLSRTEKFNDLYQRVWDSGGALTQRIDGKDYTFRKSTHMNESWAFNRRLAKELRTLLK
jgi:hypothetical protein